MSRAAGAGEHAVPVSFSVVIETDNLSAGSGPGPLLAMLDSLQHQTLPPDLAEEVVLVVEPGDADMAREAVRRYPWLRVLQCTRDPALQPYYQAKMAGFRASSGAVVVFLDCDCRYDPEALQRLVSCLARDPELAAISGETRVEPRGVYGLAMAIAFVFDPPGGAADPYPSGDGRYVANSVAMRREVLEKYPIPTHLECYRVSHAVHGCTLAAAGLRVMRHPGVVAVHPPPSPREMSGRFFLKGHDALVWSRLVRDGEGPPRNRFAVVGRTVFARYWRWLRRARVFARDPGVPAWRMAAAVPVVAWAGVCYLAGVLAACGVPQRVLRRFIVPGRIRA